MGKALTLFWILISFTFLVAVFGLLGFVAYWWIYIPRHVYDQGLPARARVIDTWNTGVSLNEEPLGGLLLEVQPPSGAPYQVKKYCRATYDNEWVFQTGLEVDVKLNTAPPPRVVLVSPPCDLEMASILTIALIVLGTLFLFMGVPAIVGSWLIPLVRRLLPSTDLGEVGQLARATVLGMHETGWSVNDKPGVTLDLQVTPPGDMPYQVTTVQTVSPAELPLLYPGAEVHVKYDPRRPRRIQLMSEAKHYIEEPGIEERLEKLDLLYERHLISEEEYQRIRDGLLQTLSRV